MSAVIIPADGYRGDVFVALKYERCPGPSWDILEGEGLTVGRTISRGELAVMLSSGLWTIRRDSSALDSSK